MRTPMAIFNDVMKKKKKNRKGFSLVELIVVLVIMAILIAALVPSLVGYIRQARQSNAKDEAAAVVQAAQTIVSSAYASPNNLYDDLSSANKDVDFSTANFTGADMKPTNFYDTTIALAEVKGSIQKIGVKDGVITYVQYEAENKDKVTYLSGKYTVGDNYANDTTTYSATT